LGLLELSESATDAATAGELVDSMFKPLLGDLQVSSGKDELIN